MIERVSVEYYFVVFKAILKSLKHFNLFLKPGNSIYSWKRNFRVEVFTAFVKFKLRLPNLQGN